MAAVVTLGLSVGAGATGPTSGSTVSNAAQPQSPFTSGIPFSSGQRINVVIPANSAFAAPDNTNSVNVVECAAPNGVVPTQTAACDSNTIQGGSITPNSDGSFTYTGYPVFALPDSVTLQEGSGGPNCGQTAATECILYVGNNQLDFTQPHVWSAPFFIGPDVSDAGTNPGDGSPPAVATVPSATLSTAVASPAAAAADGVDLSTVTVTLLGTGGVPVQGKAVSLTSPSTAAKVSGPSPPLTDAHGQTTFTVTDTLAESVTLTAADTTDSPSVTLSQQPVVSFQAPRVDAGHSTVTASPTTITAGNSTTITVTLRDQASNAQPVANQTVTLAATGTSVITPAATPNVTNASGVVTFTATDPSAETVTFTATDTTESTAISNTASVTFDTVSVSAAQSTVTASTPAAVGSTGTTVVVTLLTSTSSPVAGKVVGLQSSSGTGVIGAPSPAMTGSNGQVSFSLNDSVAEKVTVTATDTTDGISLSARPTVTFATSPPSATASTVLASATTSPADGTTQTLITVTVNDQSGNPLPGKTVAIQGAPAGNVDTQAIAVGGSSSTPPGITNGSGIAEFEVSDTHAEMVTFTATDNTDNMVLAAKVSVTYLPGPADPAGAGTTVRVGPANPSADGSSPSTITVTLADHFSNPVAGKTIALKAVEGYSLIAAVNPVTDQAGQATFTVTDSTAEIVTYQALDVTDGNATLTAEGVVTFGNPSAPPPLATSCSVVAIPSSVPADGTHTSTISVLLRDGKGDPVAGKTVTLAESSGASKVAAANATTNNSGTANFAVSDSTAETVKFMADDTSDSIDLTAIPVTVTFTAAATTSTSSTTSTTSTTSSTSSTTTTSSSSVTTTTGAAPAVSLGATSTGSSSGSSGTSALAATGPSWLVPWLIGFGALFVGVGTIGRRRFNEERKEA